MVGGSLLPTLFCQTLEAPEDETLLTFHQVKSVKGMDVPAIGEDTEVS